MEVRSSMVLFIVLVLCYLCGSHLSATTDRVSLGGWSKPHIITVKKSSQVAFRKVSGEGVFVSSTLLRHTAVLSALDNERLRRAKRLK